MRAAAINQSTFYALGYHGSLLFEELSFYVNVIPALKKKKKKKKKRKNCYIHTITTHVHNALPVPDKTSALLRRSSGRYGKKKEGGRIRSFARVRVGSAVGLSRETYIWGFRTKWIHTDDYIVHATYENSTFQTD